MLSVGQLNEGVVLDHIPAGKAMDIYRKLKLNQMDCQVAMIMQARSSKMGLKDIIKVECPLELLNLDALGFIDHTITVNIIRDGEIVEKKKLKLPKKLVNIIHCKNPRCITASEKYVPQSFHLVDRTRALYRCEYCDTLYKAGPQGEAVEL